MANLAPAVSTTRVRPKLGRDDWAMRGLMVAIGLYLIIALALPLYAMMSKSFEIYTFQPGKIEFQVNEGQGWGPVFTALERGEKLGVFTRDDLITTADGRIQATRFFPDFSFLSDTRYRMRNTEPTNGGFMIRGEQVTHDEWVEYSSGDFRRVTLRPALGTGVGNYLSYFSTPALFSSIYNSLTIALISTLVTVTLAFGFAYALTRSGMRFKGTFKAIAMVPILVPSLLPGIALIYLFGRQSLVLKILEWLLGEEAVAGLWQGLINGAYGPSEIYGPIGIVIASVFSNGTGGAIHCK